MNWYVYLQCLLTNNMQHVKSCNLVLRFQATFEWDMCSAQNVLITTLPVLFCFKTIKQALSDKQRLTYDLNGLHQ